MNNSDQIVAALNTARSRHGFGVPSGNALPPMEATRTGGITFVLTAREGSALLPTGLEGLRRRRDFCVAILGPGAATR